jgi:hypothetical protein
MAQGGQNQLEQEVAALSADLVGLQMAMLELAAELVALRVSLERAGRSISRLKGLMNR